MSTPTEPDLNVTADTVDARSPTTHTHLAAGTHVGRYVVQELIGEGGMGAVYKAFDAELNRAVALKVIGAPEAHASSGPGGRDRLLREAQALARLSHPHVLPVYDVGTFGEQVFIATEFVAGVTLRVWLKLARRPLDELLRVFVAAGEGLAAAHRAELIHRDFKPENVMLGEDGRIRVLDFGLVRAARRDDSANEELVPVPKVEPRARPAQLDTTGGALLSSPLTLAGSITGTPRYMAPEQHRGDEVDARADQFAFAVALYEALYGVQPFRALSLDELKERVTAGAVQPPPSGSPVPRRLWRVLERALSATPAARYPTMDALLGELRCDLRPLAQRWRAVGLGVAAGALVVGTVALVRQERAVCRDTGRTLESVWGPARKQQLHHAFAATKMPYAESAFAVVEKAFDRYAHDWTTQHAAVCEAVPGRGSPAAELFDLRMECLNDHLASFGAQVDVLAAADAHAVERAGHAAAALPPLDECADEATLRAPVRPPADAATRAKVADLRKAIGRTRALEASGHYPDGLKLASATAAAATALHYRPVEAEALLAMGELQSSNGDTKAAADTLHGAELAADAGRADETRADALIMLVEVAGEELGRYDEAHRDADEAQLVLQRVEHRQQLLATLERNVGILAWREGKYDAAIASLDQALDRRIHLFGAQDPRVAETLSDLGDALSDQGKTDEALALYRRALAVWVPALGAEHPQVGVTLNNMANALTMLGKLDEALAQFRHAQAIWERTLGPTHPRVAAVLNNIGDTESRLGHYKEAVDCYHRALPMFVAAFGPAHYAVGICYMSIGETEVARGNLAAADEAYGHGLGILEKSFGASNPQLAASLADLGDLRRLQGNYAGALAAYARAHELVATAPLSPDLARALVGSGQVYLLQNKLGMALPVLQQAVAVQEAHAGDPLALAEARFALARALWKEGRERPRATTLATTARTALLAAGPRAQERLTALDQWTRTHR